MDDDALSRRNLGPAEYWGRVVEKRLVSAESTWKSASSSLSGIGRSTDSVNSELSRQIEGIRDALEKLENALLLVPTAGSAFQRANGFALAPGWNRIVTMNVPIPGAKTTLNVVAKGQAFVHDDGPTGGGPGTFQWPFPLDYVTSEYGFRPGGFHSGMDFAGGPASLGSPIYAPGDGEVLSKGTDGSRGNYINLSHRGGQLITRYFHMIAPSPLAVGSTVSKAVTVLGNVGNTGSSFGAHLHWETYVQGAPLNEENYPAMNPRDFMSIYGGDEGPAVGEFSPVASRILINGSGSPTFLPHRVLGTGTPDFIDNYMYPISGRTMNATTAEVALDIYSEAAIDAHPFNAANLTAFGVFA